MGLNIYTNKAYEESLLQPLSSRQLQYRVSLYADDVVLLINPVAEDIWFQTSFTFLERLLVYIIITINLVSIPSGVMRTI
jgi:hypothetical protein